MKTAKLLIIFSLVILVQACSSNPRELKSPCVGIEGSPCDKRAVNTWLG